MKYLKYYLPLFSLLLAGCGGNAADSSTASATATNTPAPAAAAADTKTADTNEVAVIKTTEGDMVIAFWTDAAPKTIANFKKLAKSGFYDGTCFHRVIKGS